MQNRYPFGSIPSELNVYMYDCNHLKEQRRRWLGPLKCIAVISQISNEVFKWLIPFRIWNIYVTIQRNLLSDLPVTLMWLQRASFELFVAVCL